MVFRNDRPLEAVRRLMRLEFDGLPADRDRRDFEGISAVTPEAVVAAGRHRRAGASANARQRPTDNGLLSVATGP